MMSDMDEVNIGLPYEQVMADEQSRREFYASAQTLLAECNRVKADHSALWFKSLDLERERNAIAMEKSLPTPYHPKGNWSFKRLESGHIVIQNGKDWTIVQSGSGPIYEQFLFRFCEAKMLERDQ